MQTLNPKLQGQILEQLCMSLSALFVLAQYLFLQMSAADFIDKEI